jgi:OPT family oligopeptide transporter
MFTAPNGVILAMANNDVGLGGIMELIIGYALPHRPIAMMLFKSWGNITMNQALSLTSCLKIGHYMKVPPCLIFFCLVIGTTVSSTVQLGVQEWMFSHVEDFCSSNQKDNFVCPLAYTFGSSSIIVSPILSLFSHSVCLNIPSGVSLDQSISFLTVTSTTLFSSPSLWVLLRHLSSGHVTRSSS